MASKEEFAKVVGRAVLDSDFAAALNESPEVVAKSVGVRLDEHQIKALNDLSPETMAAVSSGLRDVLGPVAFVDQQQQQQARMD